MELSLQINSVFRVAGWQIVKPLPPLDSWERKADIAQYAVVCMLIFSLLGFLLTILVEKIVL